MIVPQTVTVKITQKVTKTFELGYKFSNEDSMDSKYSVSVESIGTPWSWSSRFTRQYW